MKKILFLMSCLLIQGSLLFAASNSKDNGKNSKSKVEAAAAPASAAAAAAATATRAQSKTRSATILEFDIPNLTAESFAKLMQLTISGPILVETPQTLDCPVPIGFRAFGCADKSLHQHFCKEDAEKQAHEFPILSMEDLLERAKIQTSKPVWAWIASSLKNNQNIPQSITVIPHDPCLYAKGPNNLQDKFAIDLDLPDEVLPHRIESPTPDGYESDDSVYSTESCENCPVKGASHKHFKKK